MKQKQYAPMSIAEMSLSLYAAERGFLSDVSLDKIGSFEQALIAYFNRDHADLMAKINVKGDFNDEIDAGIKAGIEKFKPRKPGKPRRGRQPPFANPIGVTWQAQKRFAARSRASKAHRRSPAPWKRLRSARCVRLRPAWLPASLMPSASAL